MEVGGYLHSPDALLPVWRLVWSQGRSGCLGEKNRFPLPRIEPRFCGCPMRSHYTAWAIPVPGVFSCTQVYKYIICRYLSSTKTVDLQPGFSSSRCVWRRPIPSLCQCNGWVVDVCEVHNRSVIFKTMAVWIWIRVMTVRVLWTFLRDLGFRVLIYKNVLKNIWPVLVTCVI